MRRLIHILTIASLGALAGCAGFSGERSVKCNMNILGNTVEWESTASGTYPPPAEPVPAE